MIEEQGQVAPDSVQHWDNDDENRPARQSLHVRDDISGAPEGLLEHDRI
jgi:hypothetical protein